MAHMQEASRKEALQNYTIDSTGTFLRTEVGGTSSISISGAVSNDNSTSTPLGISGTFVGTAFDITKCGIAFISTYSDKVSATDGLSIQQSHDGTNWDHSDDYTVAAAAGKNYSINPFANYMRVLYYNGTDAQTEFRLQTVCKGYSKPSSHRVKDAIIGDDDAELVKAVLTGKSNGVFKNVLTTEDGDLKISDNSNGLAIAEGNVTGKSFIHKFGNAPDFDTGDNTVTIWDGASDSGVNAMAYTYSTTADIDSIVSNYNTDKQPIEIQGLDSGYNVSVHTISLDGTNRVALGTSLIRTFRLKNTGTANCAGIISCYGSSAITDGTVDDVTKVRAVIDNGNNQTEMAVYTIPAGKIGYLRGWYASSAGANKTTNYIMKLKARPFGQVFQLKHRAAISDTVPYNHQYVEPEIFTEKTDLEMTTQATAGGVTGASVSAGFDIVLEDN